MKIHETQKGIARVTMTYPKSKKDRYIELIFTYEDEEKEKTANVRVSTDSLSDFITQLNQIKIDKSINDL